MAAVPNPIINKKLPPINKVDFIKNPVIAIAQAILLAVYIIFFTLLGLLRITESNYFPKIATELVCPLRILKLRTSVNLLPLEFLLLKTKR